MKRFLVRSVLFALLVIGAIGSVCVAEISAEIHAYRREVCPPDGLDVLVCNDSQTGGDVDPEVCPRVFNFSAHGRALDQAALTVLDVLEADIGRQIKTVVFDVTPAAAVASQTCRLADMGYSAKYWLIHYLHPEENIRDLDGGLVVARDNLVGRRLRHFWRALRGKVVFRSSLFGEFITTDIVDKRSCPRRYWALLKGKANSTKGLTELTVDSPFAVAVLDQLVERVRASGRNLLIITTPWNADLRTACGAAGVAAFGQVMEDYARTRNCAYANFLSAEFADEEWGDGNHLNRRGARRFTRLLADELARRGY